jgi:hypothetical protein
MLKELVTTNCPIEFDTRPLGRWNIPEDYLSRDEENLPVANEDESDQGDVLQNVTEPLWGKPLW